ncbi:substrate-binding domain-containing protein, partial [Mariniblastus sp.]
SKVGVPVVNVWLNSPATKKLPGVFADFQASGRIQAEHLLSRGLRNFAAVVAFKNRGQEMELREFRKAIELVGCSCLATKISQTHSKNHATWQKTRKIIAAWMDTWRTPIGVMVGYEDCGRLIVQMCSERGWRVPQDVAIIAGQNEEKLCEYPRPSLTSMEFGYENIGYESGKLLQSLMEGGTVGSPTILLPPKGLVIRESTDFFAVEDELVAKALEFIGRMSHRRIKQDDVSRAVNAETRTLQLRFRKVLDRPIAAEIRRVRIERAKRELTQSKRLLSDIARDVGFGEAKRMNEVFVRELGVTSSEYRNQRQVYSNR